MPRNKEGLLDLLSYSPWWMSVAFSLSAYIGLKYLLPFLYTYFTSGPVSQVHINLGPNIAPWVAFALLIPAPFAYMNTRRKRMILDSQKDISTIRSLTWKEFEELIAEAYRRQGFSVVENHEVGPDDGVDILVRKENYNYVVQCKHWNVYKVGVRIVREMFGIMNAISADGVKIITSGQFTQDAKYFAKDKPIELIDGEQLLKFIDISQVDNLINSKNHNSSPNEKICPECGEELVIRVARKGENAGKNFWGCSNFPKCRFTKDYLH